MIKTLCLVATALVALSGPLRAQGMSMPGHSMAPSGAPAAPAGSPAAPGSANSAYMDAMHGMNDAMAVKPTGDPDRDFAGMMLAHHQGAVAMAKVELQFGKDAKLRRLARTIIAAQEKEIAVLQAWLATKTR